MAFFSPLTDEEEEKKRGTPSQRARQELAKTERTSRLKYFQPLREEEVKPEEAAPVAKPPAPTFIERVKEVGRRVIAPFRPLPEMKRMLETGVPPKEFIPTEQNEKTILAAARRAQEARDLITAAGPIAARPVIAVTGLEITGIPRKLRELRGEDITKRRAEEIEIFSAKEAIRNLTASEKIFREVAGWDPTRDDLFQGLTRRLKEDPVSVLPFVRDMRSLEDLTATHQALQKREAGQELTPFEGSLVVKLEAQQAEAFLDRGIGYAVGDMLVGMVPYVFEFGLTSGIYKGVQQTITQGTKWGVKDLARRATFKVAAKGIGASLIGAATQAAVQIPRISAATAEFMVPEYDLVVSDEGKFIYNAIGGERGFWKALAKGYGQTYVEFATERAGVIFEGGGGILAKTALGRWMARTLPDVPIERLGDVAKRIGWNGIFGEIFEEELAEPFHAIIAKREYKAPILTPEGTKRLVVETLGIGAFGGIMRLPDTTASALSKAKRTVVDLTKQSPEEIEETVEEITGKPITEVETPDIALQEEITGEEVPPEVVVPPVEKPEVPEVPEEIKVGETYKIRQTLQDERGKTKTFVDEVKVTKIEGGKVSYLTEGGVGISSITSFIEDLVEKPALKPITEGREVKKPQIPKELQPLAEEARKYKSAEELIKNFDLTIDKKPDILFRGFDPSNVQAQQLVSGRHFTESLDTAREFAISAPVDRIAQPGVRRKVVSAYKLSPNAKIADLDKVRQFLAEKKILANQENITKALKDSGYDGAVGTLPGYTGKEFIITNERMIKEIQTKPFTALTEKELQDLAIRAKPKVEVKPEVKPAVKPEVKPVVKPEAEKPPTLALDKEATTFLESVRKTVEDLNETKILSYAEKIATFEKSPVIEAAHLAEALQTERFDPVINTIPASALFEKKGGMELYERLEEVGITENLDKKLPELVERIRTQTKELLPNTLELLKLAVRDRMFGSYEEMVRPTVGKPIVRLTSKELTAILDVLESAERIKPGRYARILPEHMAQAIAEWRKELEVPPIEKPPVEAKPTPKIGVPAEEKASRVLSPKGAPKVTIGSIAKKFTIPSLNVLNYAEGNVAVRKGKLMITDLETYVETSTKLKDGMYRVVGEDLIPLDPKVMSTDDFPIVEERPKEAVGVFLAENVVGEFKKANKFVAKDESRPILTGIHFNLKGGHLLIEATDGFRLFRKVLGIKGVKDTDFVVHSDNFNAVAPILDGRVDIREDKDNVSFSDANHTIFARRLDYEEKGKKMVEFPEASQIYDISKFEYRLGVDQGEMLNAIKILAPYAIAERGIPALVEMKLEESKTGWVLKLLVKVEGAEKEVEVRVTKEDNLEGVSPSGVVVMPVLLREKEEAERKDLWSVSFKYLKESIDTLEKGKIYFGLNSDLDPIHISDELPYKAEKVAKPPTKAKGYRVAPSAGVMADTGGYSDVESVRKSIDHIKAVEFPEILRLTKQLLGDTPRVKKFRRALGNFVMKSTDMRIGLDTKIFEEDTGLAAKVLAHELGHLMDVLPEKIQTRGNIVGRIASLHKHLKRLYGDLDNAVVRQELRSLSQLWKPFDEAENPSFTKYRYSSHELYAEAISVLFNDPYLLRETAPSFWDGFFDYLDRKPQVEKEFFELQDLLNSGEEKILEQREKEIREMFRGGDDVFMQKHREGREMSKNWILRFKTGLRTVNQRVIDKVRALEKRGIYVAPEENPIYYLEELNYTAGVANVWMQKSIQPIWAEFAENDISWEDFGELLFLKRAIHERGKLANPLGYDKHTANTQLEFLRRKLGDERWAILEKSETKFRESMKPWIDKAGELGFYKGDLVKEIKANPAYATFQVLDYFDTYIPASIKHQVGTLKEIANPATATVSKHLSLIRALEVQEAKMKLRDLWFEQYADEIEPAETRWTGRTHIPIESKDPDKGLFTLMVDGKYTGYYVDPFIADAFTKNKLGAGQMNAIIELFKISNSKVFRPLFITLNVGFQGYNLVRDSIRLWRNIPNSSFLDMMFTSPIRIGVRYFQAVQPAWARAWGKPNKVIQEMQESKILGVTFNDLLAGRDEFDTQMEAILGKYDLIRTRKTTPAILKPAIKVIDFMEKLGNFIETLPKVVGYEELKGTMPSKELGSFIRTSVGSPDFLTKGSWYFATNNLFLFSNAMIQAVHADYDVSIRNPRTRSGFWFKWALSTGVPKMLMFAALAGAFGDDIKKMMESASEYDKTNYTIIPLGWDEDNAVYLRIPTDETSRVLGGVFWKGLRIASADKQPEAEDLMHITSIMAGQIPSPSPVLESALATLQYLAGQNPYDFYRGRNVLPDDIYTAGTKYSLKPFVISQLQNLGLNTIIKTYVSEQAPRTETWGQKVLSLPILSNVFGRWIKISNYGQIEKNREIIKDVEKKQAQRRVEEKRIINSYVREYFRGEPSMARRAELRSRLFNDVFALSANQELTGKEKKTKRTNIDKKFRMSILRGSEDANVISLIDAYTNDAKIEILKGIKKDMEEDDYKKFLRGLRREKIISLNVWREAR